VSADDNFLSRWSRRKHLTRRGEPREAPPQEAASQPPAAPEPAMPAASPQPPAPLPPVESLTPDSDFAPFMQAGVDGNVKRDALKKLFADPRFNVMDGLDVYIDDYSKPDPLPDGWLEKMNQVRHLGIFRDDPPPEAAKSAGEAPTPPAPAVEGEPRRLDAATAAPRDPLPASQGDKDPTSRS